MRNHPPPPIAWPGRVPAAQPKTPAARRAPPAPGRPAGVVQRFFSNAAAAVEMEDAAVIAARQAAAPAGAVHGAGSACRVSFLDQGLKGEGRRVVGAAGATIELTRFSENLSFETVGRVLADCQ